VSAPAAPPEPARPGWRTALLALGLALATALAFAGATGAEFVSWDDPALVTRHPLVARGLSLEGLRWALFAEHGGNWHPLTSLSHMLDVELFGLDPAGHHATSLALHVLNVLLAFGLVRAATGAELRAALVAGLFGLHPLRVESVAWVAERKDVLSAAFGLGAAWAWLAWTRRGGSARYAASLALFAAGLAAKPMLVTLPLALWIADRWPLGRLELGPRRLLLEKLPLLALALADGLVTLLVQRSAGALRSLLELPLGARLANAALALWRYLEKSVWPSDLAIFHPHPWRPGVEPPGALALAGAALGLALVTALAWRRPWTRAGWLGFVIGLLPVLGLLQVGRQAWAERYTYLPSIALAAGLVWGLAELARGTRLSRPLGALGLVALAALFARTREQVLVWRDSLTLFAHAVRVHPDSGAMHADLGNALKERGLLRDAEENYRRATELEPEFPWGWFDLGFLLDEQRRDEEARAAYERALEADPRFVHAWVALGALHLRLGEREAAAEAFERALALEPGSAPARAGLRAARAPR
jgi:tetratricopeptide (TPR) repeat protein